MARPPRPRLRVPKGFYRTRRAHKKCAFGDFTTKPREFLGIAQKLYNLFQLFLSLINASHFIKGNATVLFSQQFGLRFTKAHRTTTATALHPVHKKDPDTNQQQNRKPQRQQREEARLFLRARLDPNTVFKQQARYVDIRRLDRLKCSCTGSELNRLTIQSDRLDTAIINFVDEIRICHRSGVHCGLATTEQVEKRQDQQKQDDPECDVSRVAQKNSPYIRAWETSSPSTNGKIDMRSLTSMR
jgi:hypothetical protein